MGPFKKTKLEQLDELGLLGAIEEIKWPEHKFGDRTKLKFHEVKMGTNFHGDKMKEMQKDCCGGDDIQVNDIDKENPTVIKGRTYDLQELVEMVLLQSHDASQNNFDRLNLMVNELKGIVSQVRGDYQDNRTRMIEMDSKINAIFNFLSLKNERIE